MSKWEYKVIKLEDCLGICEVHEDDDSPMCTDPIIVGDTIEDLKWILNEMNKAINKGITNERF